MGSTLRSLAITSFVTYRPAYAIALTTLQSLRLRMSEVNLLRLDPKDLDEAGSMSEVNLLRLEP